MSDYTEQELERLAEVIFACAEEFGLDMYPQEFELCDHHQMIGYIAYSGMPSRYAHWSFGKAYELKETLYRYGISGLPYEMVINADPALAYLMKDNSLALQILTMAHVAGHNDFFKNNSTFRSTHAKQTIEMCKVHARRVRDYIEDPSIGITRVERVLDAAHGLALQCRRNLGIRKPTREEQLAHVREHFLPRHDAFQKIHARPEFDEKGYQEAIRKIPLEPEEDMLLFIRDHQRFLDEWEKDLLTIVHEETQYFIPQIETKILNEGWASFWHYMILGELERRGAIAQKTYLEFFVHHNNVLIPHHFPHPPNPYHLGYALWKAIEIWYDGSLGREFVRPEERSLFQIMEADFKERGVTPESTGRKTGREKIFEIRLVDRDASFLRQYLTPALMRELHLFEYGVSQEHWRIQKVADDEHWKNIRDTLIHNVGMNSIPVITIEDADYDRRRVLYLKHAYDGRELKLDDAKKTLGHLQELWGESVTLETVLAGEKTLLMIDRQGSFSQKALVS